MLPTSFRIGLSGAPGSGKSTLIEALGMLLVSKGYRVAVLAVDPSSPVSGGAILGDKTRMVELSRSPFAFVRPSPARGALGGVTRSTSEAVALCEGAGYDTVLIETVGVGQSETAVRNMVDMLCLVVAPGAGDELQGLKKGIVEVSDLILINKADGDLLSAAQRTQADYLSALKYMRPRTDSWSVHVRSLSAQAGHGVAEAWQDMLAFYRSALQSGWLMEQRAVQLHAQLWSHINDGLVDCFQQSAAVQALLPSMESAVRSAQIAPGAAADRLLRVFSEAAAPARSSGAVAAADSGCI